MGKHIQYSDLNKHRKRLEELEADRFSSLSYTEWLQAGIRNPPQTQQEDTQTKAQSSARTHTYTSVLNTNEINCIWRDN